MHPSQYFENAPIIQGGRCFLAMPFKATYSDELYVKISSALRQLGIFCHRADEDIRGGTVMIDVLRGLAEAELVIIDVTGNNPNVFYELGIAHAVRCAESTVLITQAMEKVPFDVKHYRFLEYKADGDGFTELQARLTHMIEHDILPSRFMYRWSDDKNGKAPDRFAGEDRKLYSFRVCDVIPGRGAAEFRLLVFRSKPGLGDEQVHEEIRLLESLETLRIPYLPSWAIRLHDPSPDEAVFCACRVS